MEAPGEVGKSRTPTLRGLPVRTFFNSCFEAHGVSAIGGRRKNEDSFHASERLLVVADGMGGHEAGKEASQTVTDTMASHEPRLFEKAEAIPRKLEEAVQAAHAALRRKQPEKKMLRGMGSTVAAVALSQNGKLHIAHVGDSRVYLLRNNELVQLTRDHNVGQDLRDMGEPEEKAARLDHILTRS
ncbi:MAG: protein phosphatase 2C domain-containing protein, partial [Candidatus Micrarchaeota archaeon]